MSKHDKQASMDLAESARQTKWQHPSFTAELFKGSFRWDLIHPYPAQSEADKAIGDAVLVELEKCLKTHINPDEVDKTGVLPESALNALKAGGYFGMKIPKEYGGMGLSVTNYVRAMELVASWCGSTAVWLSAHQSIGVPQPLKEFGTNEQKQKYLPRLAAGAVSAFSLTEPNVGSDPARMSTTATPIDDGNYYIINGQKLWTTNGPAAELLVVMAETPPKLVHGKEKKQITAFIVETPTPGLSVLHECEFMGIRAIRNGWMEFKDVKVPKENIIGNLGDGLKIALATLNVGRLTIPVISAGTGKVCLSYCQDWIKQRVQWGQAIGKHQAVANLINDIATQTFAIDAMSFLTCSLIETNSADVRLEAAIAKYFGSERAWDMADKTVQIRGGRGFETADSLRKRNEPGIPIERVLRDTRINRIIEGTSEIMHLFIAREAMDLHIKTVFALSNPSISIGKKIGIVLKAGLFYLLWYPKLWLPSWSMFSIKHLNQRNLSQLHYISRTSKRLARSLFHTMMRFGPKLEYQQTILAHYVDIGTLLFAMAATLSKAESILHNHQNPKTIQALTTAFCHQSRKEIEQHFRAVRSSEPKEKQVASTALMSTNLDWLMNDVIRFSSNGTGAN